MNIQNYIAKRFQHAGSGLSLDTEALAKYSDIIDLSIGDTDFTTDEAIIEKAYLDAKAGHTHYGDPKGDPELIAAVCKAWQEDFSQALTPDHVLVTASSCLGMALTMLAILNPGDEVIVFSRRVRRCADVCVRELRDFRRAPARGNHAEDEGNHFQQPDESHRHGIWARDAGAAGKDRAGV